MKVLLINKFLYPNGGSETYVIELGKALTEQGHEVQYFGMDSPNRTLSNSADAYTRNMDFHNAGILDKLAYPIRTIYSFDARKKIRRVLDDFKPDVCHINNFNYQLTPSIILEIDKWRRATKQKCKILYTAHDCQLVCPNHMAFNPGTREKCLKCIHGQYINCAKNKCIHGSTLKSLIGTAEATYWKLRKTYRLLDQVICCSDFMKSLLDNNPLLGDKTVAIHNFTEKPEFISEEKKDYVLYFGRYSYEKGMDLLLEACRRLPEINFVFAGKGDYEEEILGISNIKNVGFKSGEELYTLISKARFSVYPSIWYENCPYSVMESISMGTPVIGSDSGGLPELIVEGRTGRLFKSDDTDELVKAIKQMWEDKESTNELIRNCREYKYMSSAEYCDRMTKYYEQKRN